MKRNLYICTCIHIQMFNYHESKNIKWPWLHKWKEKMVNSEKNREVEQHFLIIFLDHWEKKLSVFVSENKNCTNSTHKKDHGKNLSHYFTSIRTHVLGWVIFINTDLHLVHHPQHNTQVWASYKKVASNYLNKSC